MRRSVPFLQAVASQQHYVEGSYEHTRIISMDTLVCLHQQFPVRNVHEVAFLVCVWTVKTMTQTFVAGHVSFCTGQKNLHVNSDHDLTW